MIAVFDLDGTLSKVNTYKVFLVVLALFLLMTLQFSKLGKYGHILRNRIRKQIVRFQMKREFYWLYKGIRYSRSFDNLLHIILMKFIRRGLTNHVSGEDNELILATAAYAFYSKKIASELGFKHCIATDSSDIDNNVECINEVKKNRVINLLDKSDIDAFYTDHEDDLPLIKVARKTFLINPTSKLLMELRRLDIQNIDYTFV